jgi:hypothetical protein
LAEYLSVCASADSSKTGPLECLYRQAEGATKKIEHFKDITTMLCAGALDDSPSKCFQAAEGVLSLSLRTDLCVRATSNAPVACIKHIRSTVPSRSIPDSDIVQLCKRAESIAPATCVTVCPQQLTVADKVHASEFTVLLYFYRK